MDKLIKKKDARILFNKNPQNPGKITELKVVEFKYQGSPEWKENLKYYQKYSSDIGNCMAGWEDWTIQDIIVYMFILMDYQNDEIKQEAYKELCRIEEFEKAMRENKWEKTPILS